MTTKTSFFKFSWMGNQCFRRKNGSNWGKNEKDEWLLYSRQDKQRLVRQTLWRLDCRDAQTDFTNGQADWRFGKNKKLVSFVIDVTKGLLLALTHSKRLHPLTERKLWPRNNKKTLERFFLLFRIIVKSKLTIFWICGFNPVRSSLENDLTPDKTDFIFWRPQDI